MKKELTWVMPCYILNQELMHLTEYAVESLRRCNAEAELVIIDDGSPMGGARLKEIADVYIRFNQNRGFTEAVNAGIRYANSEYLGIMNDDIRIAPNAWEVAKSIFESTKKVASVHPRMIDYDDEFQYGFNDGLYGKERWAQSSCFFTRMTDHLFPEHFIGSGGGYEDWYYHCKIRSMGFYTAVTDRTCFQHGHSSTTRITGEEAKEIPHNAELFKKEFGNYPEEYFAKMYPDQMKRDWAKGFELITITEKDLLKDEFWDTEEPPRVVRMRDEDYQIMNLKYCRLPNGLLVKATQGPVRKYSNGTYGRMDFIVSEREGK